MTGFAVDLELLADVVERITVCGRRLEAVQDEVDARMKQLQVVWRGVAAAEHAEAHQRWVAGAAQMHEALAILRTIASTAHGNYSSAVQANVRMWAL